MENIFKLELGDVWCDGHGMHKNIIYKSNKTAIEVADVFVKAVNEYKIPISLMCGEYEETEISFDIKQKLLNLGFNIEENDFYPYDEDDEDSKWYATLDGYVDMIEFLIKKYDNTIELSHLDIPCINHIGTKPIGSLGYGLFSH